jgi:hypothetical protein
MYILMGMILKRFSKYAEAREGGREVQAAKEGGSEVGVARESGRK